MRDLYCQVRIPAIVQRVPILLGHTAATVINGLQVNIVKQTSMNAQIEASVALIKPKVFATILILQNIIVGKEDMNAGAKMDSMVC